MGLRWISDHTEYMRTVARVGTRITLGPIEETGRVLDKDEINFAVDLDGGIYTIRIGDEEQSASALLEAALGGDTERVEELLHLGVGCNFTTADGFSPLIYAAKGGHS